MTVDASFYVLNEDKKLVPAKFLVGPDGKYIVNPQKEMNTVNWRNGRYFNADGTEIRNANPDNYLVVPYNYTLGQAAQFAGEVNNAPLYGILPSKMMAKAFFGEGSQNLQRAYQGLDGSSIRGGTHVPMFQDAASFHLGLVSALTGFGPAAAQIVGSAYDLKAQTPNWWDGKITAGQAWDNNMRNMNSIAAGANYAGSYVPGPNPSNPYGALDQDYIVQPQASASQSALNSFLSPSSGALLGTDARAIAASAQAGQAGQNALIPVQSANAGGASGSSPRNALLPRAAYFPGNVPSF